MLGTALLSSVALALHGLSSPLLLDLSKKARLDIPRIPTFGYYSCLA